MMTTSSRADPSAVKNWFFDEYVVNYLNEAPDFFTAHYTEDVRFVTPAAAKLLSLEELIAAMTAVYVEPWLSRGWTETRAVSAEVQQLSGNSYLLTAEWRMSNDAGESVTHCERPTWHYLIAETEGKGFAIFSEIQGPCAE